MYSLTFLLSIVKIFKIAGVSLSHFHVNALIQIITRNARRYNNFDHSLQTNEIIDVGRRKPIKLNFFVF